VAKQIRVHKTYRWKVFAAVAPILLLVVTALYLVIVWKNFQPTFTVVGLILQVFGIAIAIKGLRDLRKLFGRGSLFRALTTPPPSEPKYKAGIVTVRDSSSPAKDNKESSEAKGEQTTLNHRVGKLENHQKKLRERMGAFDHYEKKVKELRRELRQTDSTLRMAFIGNLDLETIGLLWLLVGLVMATVPALL